MTKNIIFCADGTWNYPGETDGGLTANTNVYKFFKALPQRAGQAPHYDDGVGSDGLAIDRLLGGAIGKGLFQKVKDGYTVIARSYDDGDRIFIFGFSRGAYTARSLAGMAAICGLPGAGRFTDQATEDAFAAYRAGANRKPLLDAFAGRYGRREVKIAMLGVWDTVGALGIPGQIFAGLDERLYGFLDTSLHADVAAAYHAVAIDERRPEFVPTLWTTAAPGQEMAQVWFAGVHADVGGGYGQSGLSDITLGWMMMKAQSRGLVFDGAAFGKYAPPAAQRALDQIHESWSATWGFPRLRPLPAGAAVANSVALRMQHLAGYRPPNVPSSFPAGASGLRVEPVVTDPPTA